MRHNLVLLMMVAAIGVSACARSFDARGADKSRDTGSDARDLSQMVAGIWIDPNGCDHWIIDDGVEGYLSTRLQPNGRPVCSGAGLETVAYGPFMADTFSNRRGER